MRTKHTPRACDRARTSANGSLFDSIRSPLTTRTADVSNPRAPSDVLTFDHSPFVKTWPTGKGELSGTALMLVPRGTSSEAAPALAISTAPTATRIRVRKAPTISPSTEAHRARDHPIESPPPNDLAPGGVL